MTNTGTRVALIFGVNRGLGLETSRQLLAEGLNVVLTGRDDDALGRAAASLDQPEGRVMTIRMDVTDVGSIKRAPQAVERRFGRVDVLVNNAAVLLFEDEGSFRFLPRATDGRSRRMSLASLRSVAYLC